MDKTPIGLLNSVYQTIAMLRRLERLKDLGLDIIFPKICLGCGKKGEYICKDCEVFLGECQIVRQPAEQDGLTSIWDYDGMVKELIRKVKYSGHYDMIKYFIKKSLKVIAENNNNRFTPFLSFLAQPETCVSFVPMYLKKEKQRGFNQSEIIAREIGKKADRPVIKLLEKIRPTADQASLERKERLENVRDCFKLSLKEARPPQNLGSSFQEVGPLRSLSVLLVDDVYTTGATMEECVRVLKQADVPKVWGFTLARTP